MKLWEEKYGLENRKKCKRKKKDWRWNTKGNADWESYKTKIEMKMMMFALEMVDQRKEGEWTAEMRFEKFTQYWKEAAEESLGKLGCGQGKRKIHSWWNEEVTEAIKKESKHSKSIENAGICMNAFQTW